MSERKVLSFKLTYAWLSNFYPCPIEIDGIMYPTTEHAYQAAKTNDVEEKKHIASLLTPGKAKAEGKLLTMDEAEWNNRRLKIMEDLLRIKFSKPWFKVLLIRTYPMQLEEGNNWGDSFWGIDDKVGGQNNLGKILMKLRDELRKKGKL